MTQEQVALITKRMMMGFFLYDGLVLVYMLFSGQLFGELYGTEILLTISYFVIVIGAVTIIATVVYAFATKYYKLLIRSLGIVGSILALYLVILILAIATIF